MDGSGKALRPAQKADKSEKGSLAAALSLVFIGTGRVNSDSANDLVGTKAARADVDVTGSTVDDRFYATNIRLPGSVGTSVRMRDLYTKGNAFTANFAFSHSCTSFGNRT